MPKMPLVADPQLRATTGSFGGKVAEDGLHLPPEVYALAKGWKTMTAEEFLSGMSYLPGITGAAFGWPRDVSLAAIAELARLLRGHVPDAVLAHHGDPSPARPAPHAPALDYAEAFEQARSPSDEEE